MVVVVVVLVRRWGWGRMVMEFTHIDLLFIRVSVGHVVTEVPFELIIQVTISMILATTILVSIVRVSILMLHLRAIVEGRVIRML